MQDFMAFKDYTMTHWNIFIDRRLSFESLVMEIH